MVQNSRGSSPKHAKVSAVNGPHDTSDPSSPTGVEEENDRIPGLKSVGKDPGLLGCRPRGEERSPSRRVSSRSFAALNSNGKSSAAQESVAGECEGTSDEANKEPGDQTTFNFSMRDVVYRGQYRPWFHSKFKKWISIPRNESLADLLEITGGSYRDSQICKGAGSSRPRVEPSRPKTEARSARHNNRRISPRPEDSPDGSDDDSDEEIFWVCCDHCEKWRKVPEEVHSKCSKKSFFCKMIRGVTCSTPEASWDSEDEEEGHSHRKRKARGTASPKKAKKKAISSKDTPASEASAPLGTSAVPVSSRLTAVVRVLRATGKPLHYDALTKQALASGLIRFTGSQGTAGESLKAFLNKMIREGKTVDVVNVGKGVYGLQEWGSSK